MKEITLNFGAIRDSITRLSSQELIKENKNNTLKVFISEVKKNPVLFKQHLVFKNFENCKPFSKERLAERFIQQNLNILRGIKWQDIIAENKKLRITLLENSHVQSSYGQNDELFNNIHTLIESVTKPFFSNISVEQKAYEYLLEYLTRPVAEEQKSEEKNDNPNLNNWKFITKLAVNNFNERFSHLNEEEKTILNMLISDDNKKVNYIQDLKNENIILINNLLKEEKEHERIKVLEDFKNKLTKTESYNPFALDDFIISYAELKNNLNQF